jgi:hypothetical protein
MQDDQNQLSIHDVCLEESRLQLHQPWEAILTFVTDCGRDPIAIDGKWFNDIPIVLRSTPSAITSFPSLLLSSQYYTGRFINICTWQTPFLSALNIS